MSAASLAELQLGVEGSRRFSWRKPTFHSLQRLSILFTPFKGEQLKLMERRHRNQVGTPATPLLMHTVAVVRFGGKNLFLTTLHAACCSPSVNAGR